MIRADSRLLGALRKTVSTGGVARGIRVVMNETHLSVFYSVSKHARETVSLPRLVMLSTFFSSRVRDFTTFTLHDLTDFYVEMATALHYNKLAFMFS